MNAIVQDDVFPRLVQAVCADLSSKSAPRYRQRLEHFREWLVDRVPDKATIGLYKQSLIDQGLSTASVNCYMVAVRKLLREMAATTTDFALAHMLEHAAKVKSPPSRGQRMGHWLTQAQAQAMLKVCDVSTLKGLRDKCILALMFFCGLRRSEVCDLTLGHLSKIDEFHVIKDLVGKHGRIRSIVVPVTVRNLINTWLVRVGISNPKSRLFVSIAYGSEELGDSITPVAIYQIVQKRCAQAGIENCKAHDLRRTFAKLAHKAGAPLHSISQMLGHQSLETTQRYLGIELELEDAASNFIHLRLG